MRNSCIFICLLGIAAGAAAEDYEVLLETTLGDIVVDLNYDAAPITVDNFIGYVEEGFYDGLIFHRVIKDFMIQAGAYDADLNYQDPTSGPIVNESDNGLSNVQYTVAMARTANPDSATSQFFINHIDNLFLDRANAQDGFGYAVFGEVVSGMDVVDAIAQVTTHSANGMNDVPLDPVIITSATVIPEPATIILLGLGSILFIRRRKSV